MSLRYNLEPLKQDEAARWDELIAPYRNRELFHRQAWLDYLAESRGMQIRKWGIREEGKNIGYFCGGVLRKGPFKILGSPLKGWSTNYMGPIVDGPFDTGAFLDAIESLARVEGFSVVEMESKLLDERLLSDRGYEARSGSTYLVRLSPEDPETMWKALDVKRRNTIRKAIKVGLTAEDTDDEKVSDEFYDRFVDLMGRKGLVPSFPRKDPRLLYRYLRKEGLLFAIRICDANSDVLACGLFPHDERTVYYWGGASWKEGRDLGPNDLLHWKVMELAASKGLCFYDICGYGRYKKKFGGELVTTMRWNKCFSRSARWARHGYEIYSKRMIQWKGWLREKGFYH